MAALDACGFDHDAVDLRDVPDQVRSLVLEISALLHDPRATKRPSGERWSVHEYAAHCRDVLITIRERIFGACVVDNFVANPIFREERVNMGIYGGETIDLTISTLNGAGELLVLLLASLPDEAFHRTLNYSVLFPGPVSVRWVAAQAWHELFHHAADMRENLTLLA